MTKKTKQQRKYSQDFSGVSKTDRSFRAGCDVNNIVAHYQATGIDPYADRIPTQRFGHASSQSYEEAMRNVAEINSAFAELPSAERSLHYNDPARWIDHLNTPPADLPAEPPLASPDAAQPPSEPTQTEAET